MTVCNSCGYRVGDDQAYHTDPATGERRDLCRLCYEAFCERALRHVGGDPPPTRLVVYHEAMKRR